MYQITYESVASWSNMNGTVGLPASIDSICPFCNRQVNFSLTKWNEDRARKTWSGEASCPACREITSFWVIKPKSYAGDMQEHQPEGIYLYPAPRPKRKPIDGIEEVPTPILRAYLSAVNVYNVSEWGSTVTNCRRSLEGLVKTFLPEEERNRSLSQALNILPHHLDLSRFFSDLSHAIRREGNLGSHFDLEQEPTPETALMTLELLEFLLSYVFILPKKAEGLNRRASEDRR